MQDGKELVVSDFSAGVGFDGDLLGGDLKRLVDTKYARQIVNLISTGAGSLRGRRGCSQVGSSTSYAGKRLAALDNGPSGTPFLVDALGNLHGQTNLVTGVRTAFAAGVIPANGMSAWVQAPLTADGQGPLFMQNSIDTPWYWSGAGNLQTWTKNAANATAIPKGGVMTYAANRIWIAADPANPSRIYWSSLTAAGGADPGNFDSTGANDGGFIDLAPNDGQQITALVPHGPYILAFKERKIFILYDPAGGGANRLLSEQYGHSSINYLGSQGVTSTPFGVVFLADAGSLAGGTTPYFRPFITDGSAIRPLGRLPFSPLIQAALAGITKVIYFEGRLFISGPSVDLASASGGPVGVSSNGCVLEYNFETDAWWIHTIARSATVSITETFTDAIVARAGDTKTMRLFGSTPSSGRLLKLFDNDIDGLDGTFGYAWKYVSPWFSFGTRLKRKRMDAVVLEPRAGGAVVEGQVDLAAVWSVLDGVDQPNLLQSRYYTPAPNVGQGAGVLWSVRVSAQVTTGRPNLAALGFEYGKRSD